MARIQPPLNKREVTSLEEMKLGVALVLEEKTAPPINEQVKRFLERFQKTEGIQASRGEREL